jgi:glycosyltransferase involved in cell wall biosynthesis
MTASLDLSVVVCAHNSRPEYLARTLAALRAQTLNPSRWELLLIDNASTPPLAADLAWHPQARICREEKLGLTWARLRGLQESASRLLVLVDDDNVLSADYLAEAQRLATAWPQLGVWGGAATGEFETTPPDWTRKYWRYLAVRDVPQDIWGKFPGIHEGLPFGAGMCVRREVLENYAAQLHGDPRRTGLDPVGRELLRAGDLDLALTAFDCGLGAGRFASLQLTHLIPTARCQLDYLLQLASGAEYSGVLLKYFRGLDRGPESRLDQLLFRLKTLRLPAIDARFARTFLAARRKAERQIASWR